MASVSAAANVPVTVRRPEDLTPDWLTAVLRENALLPEPGRVTAVACERIGTGQLSENHRVTITYGADGGAGPESLVLKVASADERGRRTGAEYGAYEREVRFYDELANSFDGPLAGCLHAAIERDSGWFTLLLEDQRPAEQGDQIAGCTVAAAEAAVDGLAALHAARWDDEALAATPWLTAATPLNQALLGALLPAFAERYAGRIEAEHLDVAHRLVASLDAWAGERPHPHALQHGDYRLDNLLFTAGTTEPPTVVDWQTVSYGPALGDLSYFLGGSLTLTDRRAAEEALVRRYHERLDVAGFAWEACWEEYRRMTFAGVLMAIAGSMLSERTDRGDDLFVTVFARHAQHALDLDAIALLPPAAAPAPLAVDPADEGRHAPDEDPLFNESWYGDFTTTEDGIAGYTRLGLYPNRDEAWLTIALVRAGRPAVIAVDFHVPLPAAGDDDLTVASTAGDLTATHAVVAPLERFAVRVDGVFTEYADPAAVLRDEPGVPVRCSFDLAWQTDGVPYQYRITSRYEIPCHVTGTVTVGEETFTVDGAGQRDHSWGTRDWWSMDWCWTSGRLEDGTRFHGTEARLPGQPRFGMGYVQEPGGTLHELTRLSADETARADDLIETVRLDLGEPGLELTLSALAHGPLRLTSDDGRVAQFPRALYRVEAADGRSGLAWTEFNRNGT